MVALPLFFRADFMDINSCIIIMLKSSSRPESIVQPGVSNQNEGTDLGDHASPASGFN